ncbi:MAG: hypothetical protein GY739_07700 [Mesoflavibacter sp.]|nr:hypothetical protein [Mesoflavibacter sp.]
MKINYESQREIDWREARSENTINSYNYFLVQHQKRTNSFHPMIKEAKQKRKLIDTQNRSKATKGNYCCGYGKRCKMKYDSQLGRGCKCWRNNVLIIEYGTICLASSIY